MAKEKNKRTYGLGIIDPDEIGERMRKDLKKTVNETIADFGGELIKRTVSSGILKRIEKYRGGD